MKTKYFYIAIALMISAVVSIGFAESFSGRPTQAELDTVVTKGTQCARGANERCWATQYQTNPVAYRVAPFTNTAGFYLDQTLMGTMASKIRSLVPYYANTNTVYNGTTNITMLTVTGVWAQLEIGDHTNQFTCVPAIGTNPPTYGDDPWWIYKEDLEERYKVLNALKMSQGTTAKYIENYSLSPGSYTNWSACKTAQESAWIANSSTTNTLSTMEFLTRGGISGYSTYNSRMISSEIHILANNLSTAITYTVYSFLYPVAARLTPSDIITFSDNGFGLVISNWNLVDMPFGDVNVMPEWCDQPVLDPPFSGSAKGFSASMKFLYDWNFQYCTNKYW